MIKDIRNYNAQIMYFSHGGGPLPILADPSHNLMIQFMKNLPCKIKRPDAIVVISAHWEENVVSIQSGSEPEIMYDYFGFPEAAYNIKYRMDDKRPYDHGSYIPLKIMYPTADIPVIQISLHHNLDPLTHLNIGKALRPLLEENLLIIGSGFSFHNMRSFDFAGGNEADPINNEFQDKLIDICCNEKDEEKKWEYLTEWENISGARYCHPREEHLLPLLVCVGFSIDVGTKVFDDYILGKRATAFLWD